MNKSRSGSSRNLLISLAIWGAIGVVLQSMKVFAQIHEFGHVFAASITGGRGKIIAWDMASVYTEGAFQDFFVTIAGALAVYLFFSATGWWAARCGRFEISAVSVGVILYEAFFFVVSTDMASAHTNYPALAWTFTIGSLLIAPVAAGLSVPVAIDMWKVPWKPILRTRGYKKKV